MKAHRNHALHFLLLATYLTLCVFGLDNLGVKFIAELAEEPADNPLKRASWGSIVEIDVDADCLTDGNIAWFAQQGSQAMIADWDNKPWKQYNVPGIKQKPAMFAAIAIDNRVYLASSMRSGDWTDRSGSGYFKYAPPQVENSLRVCMMFSDDAATKHRNQGSCAEVLSSYIAFKNGRDSLKGGRGAAWVTKDQKVVDPCGDAEGWGCKSYVDQIDVDFITPDTKPVKPDVKITVKSFSMGLPSSSTKRMTRFRA